MFNVAIDGPSSSGKGTIARVIAEKLGFIHLDTGAMYRTAALACVEKGVSLEDEKACLEVVENSKIEVLGNRHILLNGNDVTQRIRYEDMSDGASRISVHPLVRKYMVKEQQRIAAKRGYVLEGRDITSVVLPDAQVKIFLSADVNVRAQRRYDQLSQINPDLKYDDIFEELVARDKRDTTRVDSPLVKVQDAIEIDSTHLSIAEVVNVIMNYIESRDLI